MPNQSIVENFKQMKTTKIALYKIFRRMGVHREELSINTDLNSDLFFDSDDMNIFLFFLETTFKIDITEPEIPQLQTVNTAISFIEKKTGLQ